MTTTTDPFRTTVPLPPGGTIPLLGFGTWQITGDAARQAVGWALEAGYRHLDTATVYRNEAEVGAGLRDSGLPREDVFLTTKVPPNRAGQELATLQQSLTALGTDHVDLWLIHWPNGSDVASGTWRALVEAREQGLARSIGVSNYSLGQLDALTEETGVTPAVNQIEWSPFLFDAAVADGHRRRGVALEGYSPFQASRLDHPTLTDIAARLGKAPTQVIVRWHLQHEVVVIPKSANRERIVANAAVGDIELTAADMAALDGLAGQG